MKKIYWRPTHVSRRIFVLIGILALVSHLAVETFQRPVKQAHYEEKEQASLLALKAFKAVKTEVKRKGYRIDKEFDPAESGLIGSFMTPITSNTGHLDAKQTTVNPNFAAVMVEMLMDAGVKSGDTIAIGVSGSFPAINICVYAAAKTLGLHPIIISSASASQFGANRPKLSWLHMEKLFFDKKIFPFLSVAASVGGIEDRGLGLPSSGKNMINTIIKRHVTEFIDEKEFTKNIDTRMAIYESEAAPQKIKAYINVGGGAVSVGRYEGKKLFRSGLNKGLPFGASNIDSVMTRFAKKRVPVIHMININYQARRNGLPLSPTATPKVGEGDVFVRTEYNPYLAGGLLAFLLIILYALIRSDLGYRLSKMMASKAKAGDGKPQQMV